MYKASFNPSFWLSMSRLSIFTARIFMRFLKWFTWLLCDSSGNACVIERKRGWTWGWWRWTSILARQSLSNSKKRRSSFSSSSSSNNSSSSRQRSSKTHHSFSKQFTEKPQTAKLCDCALRCAKNILNFCCSFWTLYIKYLHMLFRLNSRYLLHSRVHTVYPVKHR